MPHTFHAEQWLPFPIELVFAFFANPENLPRLMPPWRKARIEEAKFAPPPPRPLAANPALRFKSIAAGVGTRMTVSFRPFPYSPIRMPWEAEISEFVWNDHFCDIQLRGPFATWKHCHSLRAETQANNSGGLIQGTLVSDDVEYTMPFGALGEIGQRLLISRQLKGTFKYRHARTVELLSHLAGRRHSGVAK